MPTTDHTDATDKKIIPASSVKSVPSVVGFLEIFASPDDLAG
jgi:hypothetical protein